MGAEEERKQEWEKRDRLYDAFEEKCKRDSPEWWALRDELKKLAQRLAAVTPSRNAFQEYAGLLSAFSTTLDAMAQWSHKEWEADFQEFTHNINSVLKE